DLRGCSGSELSRAASLCECAIRERVLSGEHALPLEGGHAGVHRVSRESGAARIFLYNWPIYVGTWLAAVLLLAGTRFVLSQFLTFAIIGAALAIAWSIVSLLVSFYVYDRSQLVGGGWMARLVDARGSWATIHAGLDAEVDLDGVMTGPCVGRL